MENGKHILLFVKAGKGYGFGHLKRAIELFKLIKSYYGVYFIIDGDELAYKYLETRSILFDIYKNSYNFIRLVRRHSPSLVVLDCRDSDISFTKRLKRHTKVLSIDDHGSGLAYSDININVLPVIDKAIANFSGLEYFIMDKSIARYKRGYNSYNRIIITFGGEDPYGLTSFTVDILKGFDHSYSLTVILGPLYRGIREWDNVEVMDYNSNFYYEIQHSDIVITSFGLTVYEAVYIGTPVVVINPTSYHNGLANELEGIINLGVADQIRKYDILNSLRSYLNRASPLSNAITLDLDGGNRIVNIINSLISREDELCPICGHLGFIYDRDDWFNHYYCFGCCSAYRSPGYYYEGEYDSDYFTVQYANQYGRTYLEDKDQINVLNRRRLNVINGIRKSGFKLLELGCALGFFLEMARQCGYDVEGVELSEYAISYARDELGLGLINADVSQLTLAKNEYDIIVAWYFIEHNRDFLFILSAIHSSLKRGGLLALSTPNSNGISFRANKASYINSIPKDHYIEFSPKSLSMLLRSLGFRIRKVVITGVHINRFLPSFLYRFLKMIPFVSQILIWLLKKAGMGDTFEIYAVKK